VDRLILHDWTATSSQHLAAYQQIDIALDPFPYHGTTTTCESLWMGVPVVALAGTTHVSRVGVSLLTCAGLAELVAGSETEFVRRASELAGDLPRLAEMRRGLRQRVRISPLTDARQFTRDLEDAYRLMWRRWVEK